MSKATPGQRHNTPSLKKSETALLWICWRIFFLFDNLEDCNYYIEKHKGGGVIVYVDIVSGAVPFKADMNLLDLIPDHLTFKEAEKTAKNYWAGSRSANPIYEYLFQGICKMHPM